MWKNNTWLNESIKAATIVAVFFLSLDLYSAQNDEVATETHPAIVKAQEYLQEGQRKQAVELLHQELLNKKTKKKSRDQLATFLRKTTELFLTEQAQKTFEQAESLYFSGKPDGAAWYEQAKKLEPYNLHIIKGLIRAYLAVGACDKALAEIEWSQQNILPGNKALELYRWQAVHCSGEKVINGLLNTKMTEVEGVLSSELYAVISSQYYAMQNFEKAISTAQVGQESDLSYPESYYWLWNAKQALGQPADKEARQYLSLCQSITPGLRRKYAATPQLCGQRNKVSDYVKSQEKKE